jgi:hypothetical protein
MARDKRLDAESQVKLSRRILTTGRRRMLQQGP